MRNKMRVNCLILTLTLLPLGALAAPDAPSPLAADAEAITPLQPGDEAPEVVLRDREGEAQPLKELLEDGPVVLIFYRGGWCPYCTTHLAELKEAESGLQALGYRLLALSPDAPAQIAETIAEDELGYTILSDPNLAAARAFGVAFHVDNDTVAAYKEYGIEVPTAATGEPALPVPAVFIVDAEGIIRYTYADYDYRERLENEELLRVAREEAEDR